MKKLLKNHFSSRSGFTLVELLVVIAILGILAVGLLAAINPGAQLAKARDASRISTIKQLADAMTGYQIANNQYIDIGPASPGTWITGLVNSGELKSVPSASSYSGGVSICSQRNQNNYCVDGDSQTSASKVVVYTALEVYKCPSGQKAYSLWSSSDGKSGIVCINSTTAPYYGGNGSAGGYTYLQ